MCVPEDTPCECHNLPGIIKVRDEAGLKARLEWVEIRGWDMLCYCVVCGELWKVDGVDKYQVQFAVRIHDPSQWQTFDDTALRKAYLIASRGGLVDEKCIWADCEEPRVNGVVLCVEHLYDTGARE